MGRVTRQDLSHRVEAAICRAALFLLRALGPVASSNLGGVIARTVGPLLPVSRVADDNLRHAFPLLDTTTRRRIVRGVWDNLGRTVAEMPHTSALRRTESGPGWYLADEGWVERLRQRGGPAIFFTGHIGNWELLPAAAASLGVPLSIVYRAAKNPYVDALIAELRGSDAGAHFPKGAKGARAAFGHLSRGGMLGLLMDQKLNDGIAVPLFGRMAMTAPSAAAYALRFRCPLIPAYVRREGPARFCIVVETPLTLPDSGDRQADIAAVTLDINRALERWITDWPEGWLWLHRRWPKEPL